MVKPSLKLMFGDNLSFVAQLYTLGYIAMCFVCVGVRLYVSHQRQVYMSRYSLNTSDSLNAEGVLDCRVIMLEMSMFIYGENDMFPI